MYIDEYISMNIYIYTHVYIDTNCTGSMELTGFSQLALRDRGFRRFYMTSYVIMIHMIRYNGIAFFPNCNK